MKKALKIAKDCLNDKSLLTDHVYQTKFKKFNKTSKIDQCIV